MKRAIWSCAVMVCVAPAMAAQALHKEAELNAPAPLKYTLLCDHGRQLVGVTRAGGLLAWRLPAPKPRSIATSDAVEDISCSGSDKLLTSSSKNQMTLLDLNSGSLLSRFSLPARIGDFDVSPDGALVVTRTRMHPIELWDTATGKFLASGSTDFGGSNDAIFAPDGQFFLSVDGDTHARGYDRAGKLLFTSDTGQLEPFAVQVTADSKKFAVGGAEGAAYLFDSASGAKLLTTSNCGGPLLKILLSPDGQLLVGFRVDDFTLKPVATVVWDTQTGAMRPVDLSGVKVIGSGKDGTHILLIALGAPQKIDVYSIR